MSKPILPEYHEPAALRLVAFIRFLIQTGLDPTRRHDYEELYRRWRDRPAVWHHPPGGPAPSELAKVAEMALSRLPKRRENGNGPLTPPSPT